MIFNNEKLEELRKSLQLKLQAKAFMEDSIQPFIEIATALKNSGVNYTIYGCNIPDKALLPYFPEMPTAAEASSLIAHVSNTDGISLLDKLFDSYPSVNALRYVPPLPKMDAAATLRATIDFLELKNQPVYIYYLRYAPVLKLQLFHLLFSKEDDLFNFRHGDMVIFPKDLNWLIAYSLEEEWYAGYFLKPDT